MSGIPMPEAGDLSFRALGAKNAPIDRFPTSYVAFDLETTGLDFGEDGILEIGAIRVRDGEEVDSFQTYVDTEARMSAAARKVNGITRAMVKGSPKTAEAIRLFAEFAGDDTLVGYNVDGFDMPMLVANAARAGAGLPDFESRDVMELVRCACGGRRKLEWVCGELGVDPGGHRALADARATHLCLEELRGQLRSVTVRAAAFGDSPDGPLEDVCVCFTGQRPGIGRHDLMEQACSLGARLSDRVTLQTTHLVTMDGAGATKLAKAREYSGRTGVRVLDLDEWWRDVVVPAGGATIRAAVPESPAADSPAEQAVAEVREKAAPAAKPLAVLAVVALVMLAVVLAVAFWPLALAAAACAIFVAIRRRR